MTTMNTATATVSGTTETAVVSSQPVGYSPLEGTGERISGVVGFTGNASASTVTLKVRQGSGTSGTVVYTSQAVTVAAAAVMLVPYDCQDLVGGANQYTVTATFSGAPAASGAVTGTIAVTQTGYND